MSAYLLRVRTCADALEKAEAAYSTANERLAKVRNHGGQSGYSISVNGVTIAVSVCDSRTYQGTLIRGRDMMHLGALKALGAELQFAADRVRNARAELLQVVNAP